jgi:transcription initiation factor IIE alpha subunit
MPIRCCGGNRGYFLPDKLVGVPMTDKIYYEMPAELETETYWVCSVQGCASVAFDEDFAKNMGCARHGRMVRLVRQFEKGKLISEFREKLEDQ